MRANEISLRRIGLLVAAVGTLLLPASAQAYTRKACVCYFSTNCPEDFHCGMYSDGTPDADDRTCWRMEPKYGAWAGSCTDYVPGFGVGGLCDGLCYSEMTDFHIDPSLIPLLLDLWHRAVDQPALQGGGPIDPVLVREARALPVPPWVVDFLGREVLGILAMCRGDDFFEHPQGGHANEDHIVASLVGDACRLEAGNACMRALIDGIAARDEGRVDPLIDPVPGLCPAGLPFGETGLPYPPLESVKRRLRAGVRNLAGPDADGDRIADSRDNCRVHPNEDQTDTNGNQIGNGCECGDQDGNGRVDVRDLIAISLAIFNPALVTPLCDTNNDSHCDVRDIIGANLKIFGQPAYCSRYPPPTP